VQYGVEKRRLAVCPAAEQDEHGLLLRVPGNRPPGGGLQKANHLGLVVHDFADELLPQRAVGLRIVIDVGYFRDHVLLPVAGEFPGQYVERPVSHVQKPGVGIKLFARDVQPLDPRRGLYRRFPPPDAFAYHGELFYLDALPVIVGFRQIVIDVADGFQVFLVYQSPALVRLPVRPVPDQPFFPCGVVPYVLSVLADEPRGVGRVGKLDVAAFQFHDPQIDALVPNLFSHQNLRGIYPVVIVTCHLSCISG